MKNLSYLSYFLVMFLVILSSCDLYDQDIESKVNVIRTTSGSLAAIRIKSYLKSGESFEISNSPQSGFTFLSSGIDSEYLIYQSNSNFVNNDSFTLNAKDSKGEIIETQNFLMAKAISCGRGEVRDTVNVRAGQTVVVDLLMNDFFCDTEFVDAAISEGIALGDGGVINYSVDKANKSASLTFNADSTPGQYLISSYTLGLNPNFSLSGASFDWRDYPEKFERFQSALMVFNVIE